MFWLPAVGRPAAFWPSRHLPIIPPVSAVKSSSCSAAATVPIPGPFDPDHLHAIGPILSPIGQLPRPLRGGVHASSRLRPLVRFDQARRCRPGRARRAGSQVFDGFSIGSSDLSQPTLGVDRDAEIVAFEFDERDPGMLEMLRLALRGAKRHSRRVKICGEAPANYRDIAGFLTGLGIDSIGVNPASLLRTIEVVRQVELRGPLGQQKPRNVLKVSPYCPQGHLHLPFRTLTR